MKSSPRLPQREKARTQQWRPNTAKKKERKKEKLSTLNKATQWYSPRLEPSSILLNFRFSLVLNPSAISWTLEGQQIPTSLWHSKVCLFFSTAQDTLDHPLPSLLSDPSQSPVSSPSILGSFPFLMGPPVSGFHHFPFARMICLKHRSGHIT